jgi:hypothetical protein
MTRSIKCALVVLAMVLVSASTHAVDFGRIGQQRVIQGVLVDASGDRTEFQLSEGSALLITSAETNTTYRLIPKIVGKDQVRFTVSEKSDARQKIELERFDLSLGTEPQRSQVLPVAVGLTGVTIERLTADGNSCGANRSVARTKEELDPAPGTDSYCCAGPCNGLYGCCEPAVGTCCSVRSPCGQTCSACS